MNNEPDYDNLYFERKPMTQKIFDTDNGKDTDLKIDDYVFDFELGERIR